MTRRPRSRSKRSSPQGNVGEWLTAADFWTLTATDLYGHVWQAEWVDANPSTTYAQPGAIVRGPLDHITGTREVGGGSESGFRGFAPTTSRVPTNQVTETVQKIDGHESKGFATNLWKVDCWSVGVDDHLRKIVRNRQVMAERATPFTATNKSSACHGATVQDKKHRSTSAVKLL
jgi:hypothetical protein